MFCKVCVPEDGKSIKERQTDHQSFNQTHSQSDTWTRLKPIKNKEPWIIQRPRTVFENNRVCVKLRKKVGDVGYHSSQLYGLWCVCVSVCISDLGDVVDGGLHAPQLRGLDVQQL